jgi:hypothetical protein
MAAQFVDFIRLAVFEKERYGVEARAMGQRVAIHHGPELAHVRCKALTERGAEVCKGVKLSVLRLTQLATDLRKLVPVDRGCAGGLRAGQPLGPNIDNGHAVFRGGLFGPLISSRCAT